MANSAFPIEIRIVFQRDGEAEISLSTTSHNIFFFLDFFWDKYQVDQPNLLKLLQEYAPAAS